MWSVMIPVNTQFRNLIPHKHTTIPRVHPSFLLYGEYAHLLMIASHRKLLVPLFKIKKLSKLVSRSVLLALIRYHHLVDSFEFSFQFNFSLLHIYFWIDNIFRAKAHTTTTHWTTNTDTDTHTPKHKHNTDMQSWHSIYFISGTLNAMKCGSLESEDFLCGQLLVLLVLFVVVVVVVNVVQFIFRSTSFRMDIWLHARDGYCCKIAVNLLGIECARIGFYWLVFMLRSFLHPRSDLYLCFYSHLLSPPALSLSLPLFLFYFYFMLAGKTHNKAKNTNVSKL